LRGLQCDEQQAKTQEATDGKQFICPNHGIIATLYCEDCKKLICQHEVFPFDDTQQGLFIQESFLIVLILFN